MIELIELKDDLDQQNTVFKIDDKRVWLRTKGLNAINLNVKIGLKQHDGTLGCSMKAKILLLSRLESTKARERLSLVVNM